MSENHSHPDSAVVSLPRRHHWLLSASLAACDVSSNPDGPDDKQPPHDEQVDQHFCCGSIDLQTMTGENCVAINKEQINTCLSVLYCANTWGKHNNTVVCQD